MGFVYHQGIGQSAHPMVVLAWIYRPQSCLPLSIYEINCFAQIQSLF